MIKMKGQKAEHSKNHAKKKENIEKNRIQELDALIEEKKHELINYKNNLALQSQLKTKLKGEKVGENIMFVSEKAKKKKK